MASDHTPALSALAKQYGDAAQRARMILSISVGESGQPYNVWVLGVVRDKRHLIVTAPTSTGNALIAVIKGQVLWCRWFNPTTAFRFRAGILRLVFEPIPLLYLEIQTTLERKIARRLPRALVNLNAVLKAPEDIQALVLDLSVGGARIALPSHVVLQAQSRCQLVMRLRMIERSYLLELACTLTSLMGASDPAHPRVQFAGVEFNDLSEADMLTLHACVQEHLAYEADWLTQVLS